MGRSVSVVEYEDVIRFEVKREGKIAGHDFPDLMQEMRFHVARQCLPRIDKNLNTGRTYVRRSVRNALINLKRAATAQSRLPHDARGKPLMETSLDGIMDTSRLTEHGVTGVFQLPDPKPDPERYAEARELVAVLRNGMTPREMGLLRRAFVEGVLERGDPAKVEAARKKAEGILTGLLHRVEMGRKEISTMNARNDIPVCHAQGADPVGYETDLEDAEDCQNCVDKFTCLPDSISAKLIDATIDIDPEVLAVQKGRMLIQLGRKRVSKRQDLIEKGEDIPDDLAYDAVEDDEPAPPKKKGKGKKAKAAPPPEPEEEDDDDDKENEAMSTETETPAPKAKKKKKKAAKAASKPNGKAKAAPKAAPKKAKKAKAAPVEDAAPKAKKKKATKAKAKAAPKKAPKDAKKSKGKKKSVGKSPNAGGVNDEVLADGRLRLGNGRTAPAPKKLPKDKMKASMERLQLGTPFDIAIGMQLIQKRRDGNDIVIKIKKDGYEWNGNSYGSLSAACMWAQRRSVSGNDMFNFTKHNNIIVKGKNVPNGSFRKGDAD